MAEKLEVENRINKVYSLILMGKKTREIIKLITEGYSVCEKTAYNYLNKAKELRDEDFAEYRDEVLSDQIAHLRNLYEKNYKIQDFKECRAVLGQIAQLLGSNAPEKKDVNLTTPPIEWIDE